MKVTTITPIKIFRTKDGYTRSVSRVESQLQSLRSQKTNTKIYPIISDFSNDLQIIEEIKKICNKYNARYINTKTNLIWNKPLALNVGIKAADLTSDLIISLDADIILRDDVIQKCINKKHENNVIVCQTYMYKSKIYNFDDYSKSSFEKCRDKGGFLNLSGNGGLQCFDREWLFKARGYDERFNLWGGIDNEIIKRAKFDRKEAVWLNDIDKEILIIHLKHSDRIIPGLSQDFIYSCKKKNVKYHKTWFREPIVAANPESWGDKNKVVGPRFVGSNIVIS